MSLFSRQIPMVAPPSSPRQRNLAGSINKTTVGADAVRVAGRHAEVVTGRQVELSAREGAHGHPGAGTPVPVLDDVIARAADLVPGQNAAGRDRQTAV